MWFHSWPDIIRVLAVGVAAYVTLVLVLRVSGNRTLAKLNAFDFVVTVALGSTLATILLNSSVSWAEGAAGLVTLALLQFVVALCASHVPVVRSLITSRPILIVRGRTPLPEAMGRQRAGIAEVRQAVRKSGYGDLSGIGAVVLETDGTPSVVPAGEVGAGWALEDVPDARPGESTATPAHSPDPSV